MALNFIEQYIDIMREAESPTEFWRWSAIATIGATFRDHIYVETITGRIYPNMYIIIYSDSGIARKAAPCKFAGSLIRKLGNTKFIAGRASMPAVVQELGNQTTNAEGKPVSGCSGILYSEELSSFLVDDPSSIDILIDLYDYHEKWDSSLVTRSKVILEGVCVSLLAASNKSLFTSIFTDKAIKGGLLGRTIIVKEDKPRHRKSLLSLRGRPETEQLLKHLKKLNACKGEISVKPDAEEYYTDWYDKLPEEVFNDGIGFGSRLGTHVLKVGMALAGARPDFDMTLTLQDIQGAIDLCIEIRKGYKEIQILGGAGDYTYQAAMIIQALAKEKDFKITRRKLIQRLFGDIDVITLDNIILLMTQGGMLREGEVYGEVGIELTSEGLQIVLGQQRVQ